MYSIPATSSNDCFGVSQNQPFCLIIYLYCHPPKTYWRLQCFHFLTLDVFQDSLASSDALPFFFPIYEVHKNPLDFPSEANLAAAF